MSISVDGNSIVFDGTVTITNATDLSTGVCTLMLTPAGGIGSMPFLADGVPGLPPVFDSVNVTTLTAGSSATGSLTLVSAGGSGVASHYTLDLGIPAGIQGVAGSFALSDATDLNGSLANKYTVAYNTATSKWDVVPQLCGDTFQAVTFTAASGNSSPQTLASVTVPAQPFAWRPDCRGLAIPSGTANTHVDLRVLKDNATSGEQVAYGKGITGAGSGSIPAYPVTLQQAFGGAISGGYGTVSAGSAATFYFQAIQTATTTDSFSVPTTDAYFTVKVDPIP